MWCPPWAIFYPNLREADAIVWKRCGVGAPSIRELGVYFECR
jgi:hypothetical protein